MQRFTGRVKAGGSAVLIRQVPEISTWMGPTPGLRILEGRAEVETGHLAFETLALSFDSMRTDRTLRETASQSRAVFKATLAKIPAARSELWIMLKPCGIVPRNLAEPQRQGNERAAGLPGAVF